MINFKSVEISDKKWMDELLAISNFSGCHHNFTNIFAWSKIYNKKVAKVKNALIVKGGEEKDQQRYFFPAGTQDVQAVIEEIKEDAKDCGHDVVFVGLSPENIEVLEQFFPGDFKYKKDRDSFDYVYLIEKMVSLTGKKLSAKRNHINSFKRDNNWSFELITADNLDECFEMNEQWCIINGCYDDDELYQEACAVRRCFKNFFELKLEGGFIRADGKIVAYTMGERLNSDTYVIHVEKAFGDVRGAYPMINREFMEYISKEYPELVYVNREEDVGDPGLRKAKKSYYPEKMEKKYTGYLKK